MSITKCTKFGTLVVDCAGFLGAEMRSIAKVTPAGAHPAVPASNVRAYVYATVCEAARQVGRRRSGSAVIVIAEVELPDVVRYCIRRAPHTPELTTIEQRCPSSGGNGYKAAEVAEALAEWQMRDKDVRVLNRHDHFFELANGGKTRAAVMKEMRWSVRVFVAVNVLLLPLAVATCALGTTEYSVLEGALPEALTLP